MKTQYKITVALLSLLCLTTAASAQKFLTKTTRSVVTSGKAKVVGALPGTQQLQINIVLPIQNRAQLVAQVKDIYNPKSANFRKFLTPKQFMAKYGPTQAQYTQAVSYFSKLGFKVNGGTLVGRNIELQGPASLVQTTFGVKLNNYKDPKTGQVFYAPNQEPSTGLAFNLWQVSGLDNYSNPKPLLSKRPEASGKSGAGTDGSSLQPFSTFTGSGPYGSFIGSDFRAAYGGELLDMGETGYGQGIGLWEYLGTNLQDVKTYYNNVGQSIQGNIYLESTDHTPVACYYTKYDSYCDDNEQTLDITSALGVAPEADIIMYVGSTDSAIFSGILNDVYNGWQNNGYPYPSVISISWYWFPSDYTANDDSLLTLAAEGVTVLAASGDYGADEYFYPAEDPYVIAVGGTQLFTDGPGGPWASELTWADSGGGLPYDAVPIPWWQQISGVITSENGGSTTWRNGPDIAANAYWNNYTCADNQPCLANAYGGTSFASPEWAGWIADYNQAVGGSTNEYAGFFTPYTYYWLQYVVDNEYGLYSEVFNDITTGPSNYGYYPTTGYDLVTGWGSPAYYTAEFIAGDSAGGGTNPSGGGSGPALVPQTKKK